MNPPVKWVAELNNVREVSLFSTADLAFWTERLRPEGLVPLGKDGKAQVLVIAPDAKFMGVRFREVSFSVLVSAPSGAQEGAFLVHAFNSCRLFAFCERALFSTPYQHGDVRLTSSAPASIEVVQRGEVVFRAGWRRRCPGPGDRTEDNGWEGPVFFREATGERGKVVFREGPGATQTAPFEGAAHAQAVARGRGP